MRKPIACALDAGTAHDQLAEWERTLDGAVEARVRSDAGTLELQLRAGADVGAIASLAQREVACCPFFEFALRIRAGGATFVVTVPIEAAAILDDFARPDRP